MTNADLPGVPSTAATDLDVEDRTAAEPTDLDPADADQAQTSTRERDGKGSVEVPVIAIASSHDAAGLAAPLDPQGAQAAAAGEGDAPSLAPVSPSLDREPEEEEAELEFQRQLHPLPRGLVELYGLLAVLFVLVPEWMAGGALFGFREGRQGSELPAPSGAWKRLPELRLASLNLAELRLLAHESSLRGYGRQNREQLTARLLRRLRTRV